ncbi:MAG: HAMP domain-containing sensor histidine kinase [Planctomycetota bacterium]
MLAKPGPEELVVLTSNLKIVERMQVMVTNLLLLARLEAGKEVNPSESVDVTDVVNQAVESWSARAKAKGQIVRCELIEVAQVIGSSVHFRLIVDNLLGNAVEHGSVGEISISLTRSQAGWRLHMQNPCTASIDTAQLGQAFYRGDSARSEGDHCGLGLALCRRLVQLAGFQFTLDAKNQVFTAVLEMPVDQR